MPETGNFHKEQGAIFQTDAAEGCPLHYEDAQSEALNLRKSIGLVDRSDLGLLVASGPDAAEYLHVRLTHSVTNLAQGQGRAAAMLEAKGRLLATLQLYRFQPGFWILTERVLTQALHEQMQRFLFSKDAAFENQSDAWAMLHLIGPRSAELLNSLDAGWSEAGSDAQAIPISDDPELLILKWDIGRVPGWLVLTRPKNRDAIWGKLLGLAKNLSGGMAGSEAFAILHMEEGLAQYGNEWNEKTIPLDVGLRERIDFQKGCYPGQEIIARIENLGKPSKQLVGLRAVGSVQMTQGEELFVDDKRVGRITSVAHSPAVGCDIALAIIRCAYGETGTELQQSDGGSLRVCELPFASP